MNAQGKMIRRWTISLTLLGVAVLLWGRALWRAPLTVNETLGSVFLIHPTDGGHTMAIFHRANPAALPALRGLLTHPEIAGYHHNILSILGQIGDASDAQRIEAYLQSLSGNAGRAEKDSFFAGLDALAALSRRGVGAATDILRAMTDSAYWPARIHFVRFPADRFPASLDVDEKVSWAFHMYAISGAADVVPRMTAWINSLPTKDQRERYGFDPRELMSRIGDSQRAEKAAIPPEELAPLAGLFNGDLDHPSPTHPEGYSGAPMPDLAAETEFAVDRAAMMARLAALLRAGPAVGVIEFESDGVGRSAVTTLTSGLDAVPGDALHVRGLVTLYAPVLDIGALPASAHMTGDFDGARPMDAAALERLRPLASRDGWGFFIVVYTGGTWLDATFLGPINRGDMRPAVQAIEFLGGHAALTADDRRLLAGSENRWLRALAP